MIGDSLPRSLGRLLTELKSPLQREGPFVSVACLRSLGSSLSKHFNARSP
jgi:hypothetical protein